MQSDLGGFGWGLLIMIKGNVIYWFIEIFLMIIIIIMMIIMISYYFMLKFYS